MVQLPAATHLSKLEFELDVLPKELGLWAAPDGLAEQLARATVAGSGALLDHSTDSAAVLRQNVTSPNGTTAAALAVLMKNPGLEKLMIDAVAAATQRSRELSG